MHTFLVERPLFRPLHLLRLSIYRRPNQGYRQPGGKDNPKSGNPLCCRILPDIAGDCRILPDIAGDCRKLHAGPRGPDIAGYCRILPDFAGFCRILPDFARFCQNIAGYCRILPDETSGKVRQRSAIFGNNGFAGYCQILPADCRKLLTTPALWFLCARYLARKTLPRLNHP